MGNNPSNPSRPSTASPASSSHASSSASSSRREPKLPHNLPNQRVAAPPEPSLAQARGSTVTHRPRNSQSRPVAHFESHASHSPQTPSPNAADQSSAPQPKPIEKQQRIEVKDEPTKPVAVPISNIESTSPRSHYTDIEPSAPPQDMSYHLTRPPRLPLPIEEEVHTPGSPIIAAADTDAQARDSVTLEADGLPRRSSAISNTTADEDEDAEELPVDKTKATVPTVFEWLRGGDRVYVTGTIFQWSKKYRLHPVENRPGVLAATIHVQPGTHHVRFIVDGNMTISPDLPTTVDFGNNLVNYIEVSADDVKPAESTLPEAMGPPVTGPEKKTHTSPSQVESKPTDEVGKSTKPAIRTKPMLPKSRYTSHIPQYLLDLDKAEDSTAYQYAAAAIEKLPTPPSLPGFLGKPILNAATPMKDDNSVLNMPNHTVLNHLATSSIKNNVLAVSGTTRYKRKYVTTIMYKPTTDDTS